MAIELSYVQNFDAVSTAGFARSEIGGRRQA